MRNSGLTKEIGKYKSFRVEQRSRKRMEFPASYLRAEPFNLPRNRWWKHAVKPKRDMQKQKCYAAEHELRREITQRTFKNLRDCAIYCRNVMESAWFQRRWPKFCSLRVKYHPKIRAAKGGNLGEHGGFILLSKWALGLSGQYGGELITLHEIAHAITSIGNHDRLWARTFVELVTYFMGREVGAKLKEQYKKHGVKIKPYKVLSSARLATAQANIHKAWQARQAKRRAQVQVNALAATVAMEIISNPDGLPLPATV
jgi:putative metallohydrolase (TIGR04338 family)